MRFKHSSNIRFVLFRFVSLHFVSFHFISFRFRVLKKAQYKYYTPDVTLHGDDDDDDHDDDDDDHDGDGDDDDDGDEEPRSGNSPPCLCRASNVH